MYHIVVKQVMEQKMGIAVKSKGMISLVDLIRKLCAIVDSESFSGMEALNM